jgi:type I restriction enzyme S subunit
MATNQGFKSFIPNTNLLSPDYLYWWLRKSRSYLNGLGVGATFKEVSKSIVGRIEIPLPPLAEQKRIAAILDKADEIKTKREQAIGKLDTLTSSTFTELFLKDSKWPALKLMEVCTTTSGGTPKRDVADYYGGEIFWVKSGELATDLVMNTEETLTFDGVKNSSAKVMPPKTVLLAMYGATIGAVSMLGVSAATNQAICCITVGEKLLPEFLVYYLKSIKHDLIKFAVGGAQPNINQDIIRNLVVPIPPASLQQIFLDRVKAIRQQIIKAEISLSQMKTTIASLQHQAFTTGFN